MEIRLNINGTDVTIIAKDAIEAGQMLAQLKASSPTQSHPPSPAPAAAVPPTPTATAATDAEVTAEDREKIRAALEGIQGNPSATILALLATNPKGMWDSEIKAAVKDKKIENLAPHLAHVSKMCTKAGTDSKAMLIKRKRPLGKGRFAYHYQLADGIASMIQAIPEFETQRGIPRFDDIDQLAGLGFDDV